jgi:hypothetical protein
MNPLATRLTKLERGETQGWRRWDGRPAREWPDQALVALIAESEGWLPGRVPSDDALRAVASRGGG